jgi:hypothetical protein
MPEERVNIFAAGQMSKPQCSSGARCKRNINPHQRLHPPLHVGCTAKHARPPMTARCTQSALVADRATRWSRHVSRVAAGRVLMVGVGPKVRFPTSLASRSL